MPMGYISPEQWMKDKAEYARKGITRGRSAVVTQYSGGVLFVAENPSRTLHKISEIYDRIAFAAVGRYNEFENLRQAGVRLADIRGYTNARRDVTGRGLANAYAQTLGTIFTDGHKPYEVELVVAEVGETEAGDQLYRLTFDGSVADERGYVVMGGMADRVSSALAERHEEGQTLEVALRAAVDALATQDNGEQRELTADQLEVAVLDRAREGRTFRRLVGARLERALAATATATAPPEAAAPETPADGPAATTGAAAADDAAADDADDVLDEVAGNPPEGEGTGDGSSSDGPGPAGS